ncbi:phosphotransferase [Edaphobacter sp. HDX4]|uniref:phosphotransferase n=1 Tax=Edaphobacter sp. HDX4 TaxID=2794064 RepID=UPI002FE54F73
MEELSSSELPEEQRMLLATLLSDSLGKLPSHLGWIDEAIAWVEAATQSKLISRTRINQFNAGDGFALIRFPMEDGRHYWLKATGAPNCHEYSITQCLFSLSIRCSEGSGYIPAVLAAKPEWNSWIMSGEGRSIAPNLRSALRARPTLEKAVRALARLQIMTVDRSVQLLQAGAFDQRLEVMESHAEEMFDYIEEAMSVQTSTRAPRLDSRTLKLMCTNLKRVCERLDSLGFPASIVHGDLNSGNILEATNCQFIDWSEAYIGIPLASLQHLLLLNQAEDGLERDRLDAALKDLFREEWVACCGANQFDEGFRYMRFLAAASALYGRGSWLAAPSRNQFPQQSYARTLAREMYRALATLQPEEALCH